ncbi:MAG: [protein-PII] uridylyltransferase [Ilumatobacteraceae bacterium]
MASTAVSDRAAAIADVGVGGRALCRRLSDVTDELLARLWAEAGGQARVRKGSAALIAVGGYGRRELAPYSDVDVVLVHDRRARGVEELAGALWYPLWDGGLALGHAVRSVDDQLDLAAEDLDTATALLSARWLAGDEELAGRLAIDTLASWRRHGRRWLDLLRAGVLERRARAGDVAYLLEPDLKDAHGGLRDVHTLWWAGAAELVVPAEDHATLEHCYSTLVDVRVALHRETGRPGDTLQLEDQDAVARRLDRASADVLMAEVAAAARTIAWIGNEAWRHVGRHQVGHEEAAADGVVVLDGEVVLTARADVRSDPALALRVARVAAERGARVARSALDRLTTELDGAAWTPTWPPGALDELVQLLLQGHRAIDVFEALDQHGLLVRLLPEWEPARSRPQRNAYHRFTVDRHLWETAANAADLADRVDRPDLLVLAALFHDLGKAYPGDHSDAGVALMEVIGPRVGLTGDDVATVNRVIRHHLLLAETAVRRDLTDPATIRRVADAVSDVTTLQLLHALTEADSLATGPSAWGRWKAQLVTDLVARTRSALEGDEIAEAPPFPDAATIGAMALGRLDVRVDRDDIETADVDLGAGQPSATGGATRADGAATSVTHRITVVCDDLPGTFARVAGVLSLRGLDVLTAWAYSAELGGPAMAASQFRVAAGPGGAPWEAVADDLRRALVGELAIEARLAERAQTYRRRRAAQAAPASTPSVTFHDDASTSSTVIEVRAPNRIGVLHRIARSLAELGLDIRHATVQSVGEDVVDTFYVQGANGRLITDDAHRSEIRRAVLHAVS